VEVSQIKNVGGQFSYPKLFAACFVRYRWCWV